MTRAGLYRLKDRDIGTARIARQNGAMDQPKRWKWLKRAALLLPILLGTLWIVLSPSNVALIRQAQQIQIGQRLAEVRRLMAGWHNIAISDLDGPDGKSIVTLHFYGDRAVTANLVDRIRRLFQMGHPGRSEAPAVAVRFDTLTGTVIWIQRGDEIVQPSPVTRSLGGQAKQSDAKTAPPDRPPE
jgi:hypothetical protein